MSICRRKILFLIPMVASLTACMADSRSEILATDKSQVQLRAVQTRAFDTVDEPFVFRATVATLQDLSFIIDKADPTLGTISATKLSGYVMRMTVTIRPRGERQISVRASAEYNIEAVSDAAPYQQFFSALEKAMFLSANQVD